MISLEKFQATYDELLTWKDIESDQNYKSPLCIVDCGRRGVRFNDYPILRNSVSQLDYEYMVKLLRKLHVYTIDPSSSLNNEFVRRRQLRTLFTQNASVRWLPVDLYDAMIAPMINYAEYEHNKKIIIEYQKKMREGYVYIDVYNQLHTAKIARELAVKYNNLQLTFKCMHKSGGVLYLYICKGEHHIMTVISTHASIKDSMRVTEALQKLQCTDIDEYKQKICEIITDPIFKVEI